SLSLCNAGSGSECPGMSSSFQGSMASIPILAEICAASGRGEYCRPVPRRCRGLKSAQRPPVCPRHCGGHNHDRAKTAGRQLRRRCSDPAGCPGEDVINLLEADDVNALVVSDDGTSIFGIIRRGTSSEAE